MLILKLLIKNAFRQRLRAFLTIIAATIAILAFGFLRTIVDAWYSGVEVSSPNRLVTRNAISLTTPLPISYKDKIKGVRGVNTVSYGNWFGGIYISEKNFFPNFAVHGETYLELYPEYIISEEEKKAFLRDRKACVAGRKVAKEFGWELGDTIVLKGTIFPGEWEFTLRGIYRGADPNVDETLLFFHFDYLNERLKKMYPQRADHVGFFIVGIDDPRRAAEISLEIDNLFKNSLAETLTETEKAFQLGFVAMTEAILITIKLISYVIIIIILAVVANTMAMNVRERLSEYATMKTMGFSWPYISILVFGESLVITTTGAITGIILTFPAAKIFIDAMGTLLPVFNITEKTLILDFLISIAVGISAGFFPAWKAINVPVQKALTRIG
ncbi:MAG: FtsX-like permease family protein [Thermodesulfovibrionales bacterium]|nr:FtsX-like permease family protein [Thermodesulfovibrionales bacterium]